MSERKISVDERLYKALEEENLELRGLLSESTVFLEKSESDLLDARAEVEGLSNGVVGLMADVLGLRRERDEAIAHDRQPYPTAAAYEAACEALHKQRDRAERAEQRIKELEEELRAGSLRLLAGIVSLHVPRGEGER